MDCVYPVTRHLQCLDRWTKLGDIVPRAVVEVSEVLGDGDRIYDVDGLTPHICFRIFSEKF